MDDAYDRGAGAEERAGELDCELTDEHGFDTHSVFIGRVRDGRWRDNVEPLLYFRGGFWDLVKR